MTEAIEDIRAERERQVGEEGWTPEHDDEHCRGELAAAAACYAVWGIGAPGAMKETLRANVWPWSCDWWKPRGRRRDLVRAGALLVAEIERLDRAATKGGEA